MPTSRIIDPEMSRHPAAAELNVFVQSKAPVSLECARQTAEKIAIACASVGAPSVTVEHIVDKNRFDVMSTPDLKAPDVKNRVGYVRYK